MSLDQDPRPAVVHTVTTQCSWAGLLAAAPGEEETVLSLLAALDRHIRVESQEILSTHILRPKGGRLISTPVGW